MHVAVICIRPRIFPILIDSPKRRAFIAKLVVIASGLKHLRHFLLASGVWLLCQSISSGMLCLYVIHIVRTQGR
jgi:hypothetical protein